MRCEVLDRNRRVRDIGKNDFFPSDGHARIPLIGDVSNGEQARAMMRIHETASLALEADVFRGKQTPSSQCLSR